MGSDRPRLLAIGLVLAIGCGGPPPATAPIDAQTAVRTTEPIVPVPPAPSDPPGEEGAIAAYRHTRDAWNTVLEHEGDPAYEDDYYDGYEYPLTCYDGNIVSWRRPNEVLVSHGRDAYRYEIGRWSSRLHVLRASDDDVLLMDHRLRFRFLGEEQLSETFVWLRRREGRWRIAAETDREHASCVAASDAQLIERAGTQEARERCEAERRACRQRCARERERDAAQVGEDASERCELDECPCEIARCFGPPEAIARMCEGLP